MRRILSYGFLTAMLILALAFFTANVWENHLPVSYGQISVGDNVSSSRESDHFYALLSLPVMPPCLNQIFHSRIPITSTNAVNNLNFLQKTFFSLTTRRQLSATRLIYILFYSQKEKDGYYIYALRKLLI